MNIEFENKKVEKYFLASNKNYLIERKIGSKLTKILKKRLVQLQAFPTFEKLQISQIGKLESLSGDMKGLYSIRIDANYRLIIKPISPDLKAESLKKCNSIIIIGIGDYHGKAKKINWIIP